MYLMSETVCDDVKDLISLEEYESVQNDIDDKFNDYLSRKSNDFIDICVQICSMP